MVAPAFAVADIATSDARSEIERRGLVNFVDIVCSFVI
jgi:hypothetical protein